MVNVYISSSSHSSHPQVPLSLVFLLSSPLIFPLPSSLFLFLSIWFYLPHNSAPSGRFLQHFNRALKITIFSFIHTGFAIMQPLYAGRLEVNPLSRHYPYKLLSDSSAPNTETNLTSLIILVYNLHTDLVFPHPSSKSKNSIKVQDCKCIIHKDFISTFFCSTYNIFCICWRQKTYT